MIEGDKRIGEEKRMKEIPLACHCLGKKRREREGREEGREGKGEGRGERWRGGKGRTYSGATYNNEQREERRV